jgi:hypothetical protein
MPAWRRKSYRLGRLSCAATSTAGMLRERTSASVAVTGPRKRPSKFFRRERTEGARHIAQHAGRVQHALVQRQPVDEGFQGGSGRALAGGAVDLAADLRVEIVGRADQRAHPHVAGVDQHHHRVVQALAAPAREVAGNALLDQPLQRKLQRWCAAAGRPASAASARPARARPGAARRTEARSPGAAAAAAPSARRPMHPRCRARGSAGTAGRARLPAPGRSPALPVRRRFAAPRGRLRQHRQGQRLRQGQLARRLVEIDQAGGAHALDIAAVGREIE